MIFEAARVSNIASADVELRHVPFGLVLVRIQYLYLKNSHHLLILQGEDGRRIRTRSGESVKLRELLSESVKRAHVLLLEREAVTAITKQGIDSSSMKNAQTIGINAIKYADLSMNRLGNYKFSFDKMLSLTGNTAPYLMYAYARVRGIQRKVSASLDSEVATLHHKTWGSISSLEKDEERRLAIHLLRLDEVLTDVAEDLCPNRVSCFRFRIFHVVYVSFILSAAV